MKKIECEHLTVWVESNKYDDEEVFYSICSGDEMLKVIKEQVEVEIEDEDCIPELKFTLKHKNEEIGNMCIYILPTTSNIKDFYYLCDGISEQLGDYAELADKNNVLLEVSLRFYVDTININDEYRNNGLGTYFLKQVFKCIKHTVFESIIFSLKAYPVETDADDENKFDMMQKRLINFYSRNGFRLIKDSEYMYLILE